MSSVSFVTGANGYLGRAICHELVDSSSAGEQIVCLVRPQRVESEQNYWKKYPTVKVLTYDMLDGGESIKAALDTCKGDHRCCYHVASVFGPTENHVQTALENVRGTEDLIKALAEADNQCKLVLTSSMAAVRASGQKPANGEFYTYNDWNTISQRGANWGSSYQWSKAESERRAWVLSAELGVPMVALCPSFIFGPMNNAESSSSYSLTLVGQWIRGESPVQSRLFVDVRDVAAAHVAAGRLNEAVGQRYIVSTESRISSKEIAEWLRGACRDAGLPDNIQFDSEYTGGVIPIGHREVECVDRLYKELGISLRPVKGTLIDMTRILVGRTLIE